MASSRGTRKIGTGLTSGEGLVGLRSRHPAANDRELLLRLAVLRLGEELVAQANQWRPPRDGA